MSGARVITARNVNQALQDALWHLHVAGVMETSRNGAVAVAPGPVVTEYTHPRERVLFSPVRDANPFFHLMEALWMLAGRNDVAWLERYNQRMKTYSDDGEHLHGAYGFRWREWFGFDQLRMLVTHLQQDRTSRRAVLSMWSANGDLIASEGYGGLSSKDLPCNTQCYIDLRGGRLNLTVLCRSNDAIWGAYGANAVHFSVLQEYLAMQLGAPVGVMRQFSHNLHVYTEVFGAEKLERLRHDQVDYYRSGVVEAYPLLQASEDVESWDRDLYRFIGGETDSFYCRFFGEVVRPMHVAWQYYKADDLKSALCAVEACIALDWRTACREWLQRRYNARLAKAAA